jgi:hypothetical protein
MDFRSVSFCWIFRGKSSVDFLRQWRDSRNLQVLNIISCILNKSRTQEILTVRSLSVSFFIEKEPHSS